MAVKVTTTVINNGQRNLNLLFVGQGDGQGQVTLLKIMDAIAYIPPGVRPIRVDKITSDVGYGIVTLYWEAAIPKPFAILGGTGQVFDYKNAGGITVPSAQSLEGVTGSILLSTVGFEAGSTFTLKLDMVK